MAFESSVAPEDWKTTVITSLHKSKGNKTEWKII